MLARRPRPGRRRARLARLARLALAALALASLRGALALAPSGHHPPPRRGLRQIALERDAAPGWTELAPGTSGPGPTYWLPKAFVREDPPARLRDAVLALDAARDAYARAVFPPTPTPEETAAALRRASIAPLEWTAWVVETFARTYAAAFPTQQK